MPTPILIVLLSVQFTGRFETDPALIERFSQPFEPFRIAGNLYYVGAHDVTAFLIDSGLGLILIDGGLPETGPMIAASIVQLGFTLDEVEILLNNHAHFDHAGGLAYLKEQTGAELVAMRGDAATLESGEGQFGAFPPVEVDRIVEDGDTVQLGEVTLTAVHTPGHTPGCTSWAMKVFDQGKPLEVIFVCSLSALSAHDLVDNAAYPEIAADFRASFARLAGRKVDLFLGSHGSFFGLAEKAARSRAGEGASAFIDPAGYRHHVEQKRRSFEAEFARQLDAR